MTRGNRLRRRLSCAALLACGALAAAAAPAGAAVTVGQTFTPDISWGGSGTFIQTASPNNGYVIPSDGVITSWSFEAGDEAVPIKIKFFRSAGGNDYTTVAQSDLVTPNPNSLNTWPTRIAVKAGDLLGEYYSNNIFPLREDPAYASVEISSGPDDPSVDIPPGSTFTYIPSSGNYQADGSAVLEPDGDRDDFGDDSQDKCVGAAGSSNGCPSSLSIDRLKQKGAKKVKVTLTVPGEGTVAIGSPGDPALAATSAKAKTVKAKTTSVTATSPQQLTLPLKLTKSAIGRLANNGKLKVKVQAVYTPPGGPPGTSAAKKKLRS